MLYCSEVYSKTIPIFHCLFYKFIDGDFNLKKIPSAMILPSKLKDSIAKLQEEILIKSLGSLPVSINNNGYS